MAARRSLSLLEVHFLFVLVVASGCLGSGAQQVLLGRTHGRDAYVSREQIAERAAQRGVSEEQALREMRREWEMRAAIAATRDPKQNERALVERAKVRDELLAPELTMPEEESASEATLTNPDVPAESSEDIPDPKAPEGSAARVARQLELPGQAPQFTDTPGSLRFSDSEPEKNVDPRRRRSLP